MVPQGELLKASLHFFLFQYAFNIDMNAPERLSSTKKTYNMTLRKSVMKNELTT